MSRDIAASLRMVCELNRLCARLPHVATPAERRLLARFDELVITPSAAEGRDVDAVVAGWRAWWRAGRHGDIASMAARLPSALIRADRQLATYALASSVSARESSSRRASGYSRTESS